MHTYLSISNFEPEVIVQGNFQKGSLRYMPYDSYCSVDGTLVIWWQTA
jgi:hypothetical protein